MTARDRLIESAADLVAAGGFVTASCGDIGEKSGMSRGAVNYHFKAKHRLLDAVIAAKAAEWGQLAAGVASRLRAGEDPLVELDAYWVAWCTERDASRLFTMLKYEAIGPAPEAQAAVDALHLAALVAATDWLQARVLDGRISPRVEVGASAELLVTAFVGLAATQASNGAEAAERSYGQLRTLLASHWLA